MDEDQRRFEKKHFVEEVGLSFEEMGLPRMAGRVLGWLLICDPPHQSMNELSKALLASKASISNTTRLLIQIGLIERLSLPGRRRAYFRLKPDAWTQIVKEDVFRVAAFRQLAERGLALLKDKDPSLKARLEEMRALSAFFERELPPLLARWEEEQKKRSVGRDWPSRANRG